MERAIGHSIECKWYTLKSCMLGHCMVGIVVGIYTNHLTTSCILVMEEHLCQWTQWIEYSNKSVSNSIQVIKAHLFEFVPTLVNLVNSKNLHKLTWIGIHCNAAYSCCYLCLVKVAWIQLLGHSIWVCEDSPNHIYELVVSLLDSILSCRLCEVILDILNLWLFKPVFLLMFFKPVSELLRVFFK